MYCIKYMKITLIHPNVQLIHVDLCRNEAGDQFFNVKLFDTLK